MEILKKKFRQKEMLEDRVQDRLSSSPVFQNKTPKERKLIKARFAALIDEIPDQKPNHPPYSEMIQRAIETLKERGGSTETSISNYITSTYEQLPWAHSRLLAHHLCKLTESGGLTVASIPHYSLSLSNTVNQQQPNSNDDDDDDDDNYDPSFPETTIRARPTGKSREEHLSHRERRKKFRFERQETQKQVQVETEKQPLLLQWPESQRRQRSRPFYRW